MQALTTTKKRGGAREGAGRPLGALQKVPSVRQVSRTVALKIIQDEVNTASPILARTLAAESVGTYIIIKKLVTEKEWQLVTDDSSIIEALGILTNENGLLMPFNGKDGYLFAIRKEKPNMKALEIALNYAFGKPNQSVTIEQSDTEKREQSAILQAFRFAIAQSGRTIQELTDEERIEMERQFGQVLAERMKLWDKLEGE